MNFLNKLKSKKKRIVRTKKDDSTVKFRHLAKMLDSLESELYAQREETAKYLKMIHEGVASMRLQLRLASTPAYNSQNQQKHVHKI